MKSSRRKLEDAIVLGENQATPEEMRQLYELDSRGFIEAIYFNVFL